jgi:hypothetical protein
MGEEKATTNGTNWTDRLPTVDHVQALAATGKIPPVWIGAALALFFPVGLYFVWKHPVWSAARKGAWTGAWAVPFLLAVWFLTPWVIFLTLLGAFGIALYLIWQSKSLDLKKKKAGTGAAVGDTKPMASRRVRVGWKAGSAVPRWQRGGSGSREREARSWRWRADHWSNLATARNSTKELHRQLALASGVEQCPLSGRTFRPWRW